MGVVRYIISYEFCLQLFTPLSNDKRFFFENRLGFDEVIVSSWWSTLLGHSVDGTRSASVDGYASDCRYLDLWQSDQISMSEGQVCTRSNFGEISLNIYENIVLTRLPALTLTFGHWSRKMIGTSKNPNTRDQNWVIFSSLVCEISCSQDFRVIACYDLDLWHNQCVSGPDIYMAWFWWN